MSPSTAVFVAPYYAQSTLRFLRAAVNLPGVLIGLVTERSLEELPEDIRSGLAAHWRVANALDSAQIVEGARGISGQVAPTSVLFGVLEQLQIPLAEARLELGISGMDVPTAQNFRDKSRMKTTLRAAGLPCAMHHLARNRSEALSYAQQMGFPIILKPPAGAGARGTFRIDRVEDLPELLEHLRPTPENPLLLEEFVVGEEHSFDCVVVDGETIWSSVSDYLPTPLEVLQNPWIQWCVLLPRDSSGSRYQEIQEIGPRALAALGIQNGLTHMEWFRQPDGTILISEVAARPPGAQITSLISYAHDYDLYAAWAQLMISGYFDPPTRKFAVGAAYFRGQGQGTVTAVHGLELAQKELGDLVVESKLPRIGQDASGTYEGEGYAILRHRETATVKAALEQLISTVRVEVG